MYKYSKIILGFLLIGFNIFAQPNLKIEPRNIRFESIFSRYNYALLINEGDQILQIDSITNKKLFYLLEFDNGIQLPLSINPNDTVKLNITLANFYNITVTDTTDTIFVHSNDPGSPRDLRIKIDFFDDDYGICAGKTTDELLSPIAESKVYFFYYGVYLFDSTFTDLSGNYSALLPKGNYTVGAYKEGYKVIFSGDTPDPFFSQPVNIDSGSAVNVDLTLPKMDSAALSISGNLLNSSSGSAITTGIVIVRKGTHTPTLQKVDSSFASSVYAGFVNKDGSYNIAVESSGYYYIQGYSGYFLPTYYTGQNVPSLFWQNADSILIGSLENNKNLFLTRDSSYGAGKVYGKVFISSPIGSNLEGITLVAKSTTTGGFYSYNFGKEDSTYSVSNLPYGSYQIVAQKIGFDNAVSDVFTIDSLNPNSYDINISFNIADVKNEIVFPMEIKLNTNYPNPFNPTTTISFSLPNTGLTKIKVYNLLGEEIAVLINNVLNAGEHKINFNANGLASGIYIVTLETISSVISQKIVLKK